MLVAEHEDIALFRLTNGDVVLICCGVPADIVDAAINRVRSQLDQRCGQDATGAGADAAEHGEFLHYYDLAREADFRLLMQLARTMEDAADAASASLPPAPPQPLDAGTLARLARVLQTVPFAELIERQIAARFRNDGPPVPLFCETFAAITEIRRRYAPNVDLLAHPGLFRHLTEHLDRCMITTLARRKRAAQSPPISLNLNLSTLTSPTFRRFNEPVNGKPAVAVVEVQAVDLLADAQAFIAVRDRLKEQGSQVLIDGLTTATLEYMDVALLAPDYVKLLWSEEMAQRRSFLGPTRFRGSLERLGLDRVILGRVDCEEGVAWALGIGISGMQGRFIDKVLAAFDARTAAPQGLSVQRKSNAPR